MEAKVKKAFPGCPDGQSITRMIEVGEIITGELATVAVREKWATKITPKKQKAEADDSEDAGNAPENDGAADQSDTADQTESN